MAYFRAGTARATHEAQQITVAKTPLATFQSNVSGLYIPEILAYIQATQSGSGDPSPSNPRAINGVSSIDAVRTGVNLCGGIDLANQIKRAIPDAVIDTTEKTVTFATNATASGGLVVLPFKEETRYTIILTFEKTNASGSLNAGFRWLYSDGNGGYTLEAPDYQTKTTQAASSKPNGTVLRINKINTGGVTKVYYDESGIFEGALTTSDFVPYTGTTATTALGGTYYGGYLNVPTGLLTITHEIVNLGSLTWVYVENDTTAGSNYFRNTTTISPQIKINSTLICSHYAYKSGGRTNIPNNSISMGNTSSSRVFALRDDNYTDPTIFKNSLNDVMVVYELETPQTVQLTPAQIEQLLGQNNVFCSSGDVAVKGWKID